MLENFRGFEHLAVEFHERLTLLVGANGSGKTSLLSATASLLDRSLSQGSGSWNFHELGRRVGTESQPRGHLHLEHEDKRWSVESNHDDQHHRLTQVTFVGPNGNGQSRSSTGPFTGVACFYRSTSDVLTTYRGGAAAPSPVSLSGNTSLAVFFEWFREREEQENFIRSRRGDLTFRDAQLQAVRAAVSRLLPGCSDLHIERNPVRMVVEKEGQLLGVGDLSDGEKRLLAICGDLAARLSLADPQANAPLEGPAVVLIDEIELHLHPGWQRVVLDRLMTTFPGAQFVVTTHSPVVIASIEPEMIRVLKNFSVAPFVGHTRGRNADALLREVMEVPERPDDAAAKIHEIAELIDDERLPEAREKLGKLAAWLGQEDSEIVHLETLISFLEGERALDPQGA